MLAFFISFQCGSCFTRGCAIGGHTRTHNFSGIVLAVADKSRSKRLGGPLLLSAQPTVPHTAPLAAARRDSTYSTVTS